MAEIIRATPPVRRDTKFKRGADWHWTIKLKEANGTAKDTTNYDMVMTIKSKANGETYDTLAVGAEITHTPGSGQFAIELLAATIDAYDFSTAVYDVIITDASSGKTCPFYGEITVIP